jgi:hypothetical protein
MPLGARRFQKFSVERPTVNARYSRKYFGGGKGVVAYTLLSNHVPLQGWLIGAHEFEGHHVFDIWYRNTSDIVTSRLPWAIAAPPSNTARSTVPNSRATNFHTDRRPIHSPRATLSSTSTPHEICISSPPHPRLSSKGENAYGRAPEVAEVIRKAGISEQTFYRWKAKYAVLEVDQVRQMAQLQEENLRLKQLVAELTLDKTMLQDVLSKKW